MTGALQLHSICQGDSGAGHAFIQHVFINVSACWQGEGGPGRNCREGQREEAATGRTKNVVGGQEKRSHREGRLSVKSHAV